MMNEGQRDAAGPAGKCAAARAGAPESSEVRVGFIALTDCAPIVMASVLGFDRKHGVRFLLSRQPSWAAVRDKLVAGELDLAHALYGLVYGVHLGIAGPQKDMAILMSLNRNGQAVTLSKRLADEGVVDGASLARRLVADRRLHTFAHTFPTGTHAMWLYYWLAGHGVDPLRDVRIVTVPPSQMVASLRAGQVDGFSAGDPWNQQAVLDNAGVCAITSQQIWPDHPEKVLGCTAAFADACPRTARAAIGAVLEACRWIDASIENRVRMAETIAQAQYANTGVDAILPRVLGSFADGLGAMREDPNPVKFFDGGAVNYPCPSDGIWFMTQYRRWGLLPAHPDYAGVAQAVQRIELYGQAAATLDVAVPDQPMRSSRFFDGRVWDGSDPRSYADSFAVRARPVRDAA